MKIKLLLLFVLLNVLNSTAQKETLYVGTYSYGGSEGIYKLDFNTKTGVLDNKQLVAKTEHPTFIALSPNKKNLYAIAEVSDGSLTAFKVKKDKTLELINTRSSHGETPCQLAINQSGDKAVVANYKEGTASIYSIEKDGALSKASQIFNYNTDDEKANVHCGQFFKNDLFIADIGRHAIYNYQLLNNKYELKPSATIKTGEKDDPRHLVLNKKGDYMYVINQSTGSITSLKKTNEGFKKIDYDSTLEKDYNGKISSADIHLSKDEHFLYGSNRGENSIAVFKRDTKTGFIEKIQTMKDSLNKPRSFTLDPTGKFLLVANQKGKSITVYSVDKNTGKLTFLNKTEVPFPVCVIF